MKYLVFLLLIIFISGCNNIQENGGLEKMNLEGKKVLMIIAPTNFRDEELLEPKKILENNKAQVEIASLNTKEASGMLGARVKVDKDISKVNVDDYDAIVFVGGTGASVYFNNSKVHSIAREAYDSGKIIAAICIAPSTLANAGILEGKQATSWSSEQSNLEKNGAIYKNKDVVQDGNIITANGPSAAKKFGETLAKALS